MNQTKNLYEYKINVYKYWENGFGLVNSIELYSTKPLKIKNKSILRKYSDYIIEKEIYENSHSALT